MHVKNLLGINSIGVSTDDMKFDSVLFGAEEDIQVFNYSNVYNEIKCLLSDVLSENEVNKILYENSYNQLFRKEV